MTTIEVLGTCHHDCPDSCGWVATSVDGTLTSVKGNPEHPFSKGELCPKVNKFVGRVNHDDRLLSPLIRTGAKGSGEFRVASWDEALMLVATEFDRVRTEHGGEAILPWWSAGTQGLIQNSGTSNALFALLGASEQTGSVCGMASGVGMATVYGNGLGTDPLQAEHSDQIILWGTNTRLTNRHLWPTIETAQKRGARVIVIDPIRTITADKADQHIQPLPGTDVAMILAIIHVLIAEDLVDTEHVAAHALGFDELAAHVESHTPEWAAPLCGLTAEAIRDLARSIGNTKATMIRGLIGVEHHFSGPTMYRLLSMIPVLTGSHKTLGGGFARSVGSWAEVDDVDAGIVGRLADIVAPDAPTRRSFGQPQLGATLTELDDPIHALFIWNGNPVLSMPNSGAIRRGLERSDLFTVVSEHFMTDTARYADVVLPAAMETEQVDVMPAWGHLWIGWNEPAAAPRGEAVPNTELFRRMATACGFDQPELQLSDMEQIELAVGDHVDVDELRSRGFVRVSNFPVDHLPYAHGGFDTPSGKAELVAESFEGLGVPRLPQWVPIEEGPGAPAAEIYPLFLQSPKKATRFLNTSYSDLAAHADRETKPHVELDESDAQDRGLEAGDVARVFNDRASLVLPVAISDRLRPGVISVPWGFVDAAYGDAVGSVNDLTNAGDTEFGSGSSYGDTLVQVTAI
ncbi:MAG: anaerobic selenocysteine-containing dehydrogenase [Verrucomicrobiales bacterium]|jgi:anaerobic selenocysteine-containing dehydrogenase